MGKCSETKSLMLKCQAVKSSVSLGSEISHCFSKIIRNIISGFKVKCSLEGFGLNFGRIFEELPLNLLVQSYSVFWLLHRCSINQFHMFSSESVWLISHKISPSLADRLKKIMRISQK